MKNVFWIMSVLLLVGTVVFFAGCKKQEEPMAPEGQHSDMNMEQADQAAKETIAKADDTTTEQTLCPVMGNPIDKDVFVEYEGKKVYFCCQACVDTFKADPEKYLSKLPQFQK